MAFLSRLAIASAGGLVVLAVLLMFFAYLLSDEPAARRSESAAGRTAATDAWLGRCVFRGAAVGDRVEFDRDGVTESVRPTDGVATGMKWLADKADCLTIRYGEGYCRD